MHCEESVQKCFERTRSLVDKTKSWNTKPINNAILNNDYNKRFVRQSDLYSETCLLESELLDPALDPTSFFNNNQKPSTNNYRLSLRYELRAQSQAKDIVIVKLKEQIKSLKGNVDDSKVKIDMDEIETLNIELEHREQGLVIAALKNELRKLKGKAIDKEAIETHSVDPNCIPKEKYGVRLQLVLADHTPSSNTGMIESAKHQVVITKNKNSKKQDNSDFVCINCDDCMSSDNLCVSNSMNDVKFRAQPKKSKSKKNKSKKDIWKPTGKVFTQ
ncbi:hypothetical protein Tco_0955768, partial [Tanacetum coccineum]